MSVADSRWKDDLNDGEQVRWEGRPAPRCYTFRHWRHSIFGFIFLAICLYWQILGVEMAETYAISWLVFLPTPFLLAGIYFAIGHLVQARLEWNNVFYAITDQRLIVRRGLKRESLQAMTLNEITYFTLHRQGEELGTLKVHRGTEQKLILHCIEHPMSPVKLLEDIVKSNTPAEQDSPE